MVYDFLYKGEELLIGEISYCYAHWAIHDCPGYWDRSLNWHEGQVWPEDAQVDDFIEGIKNEKN